LREKYLAWRDHRGSSASSDPVVLDQSVHVAVWLDSEPAALQLETEGWHLWSNHKRPKIQPVDARDLGRTVFEILIFPLSLDRMNDLIARPSVIRVRYKARDSVDPPFRPQ